MRASFFSIFLILLFVSVFAFGDCAEQLQYSYYAVKDYGFSVYDGNWGCVVGKNLSITNTDTNLTITSTGVPKNGVIFYSNIWKIGTPGTGYDKNATHGGKVTVDVNTAMRLFINASGGVGYGCAYDHSNDDGSSGTNGGQGGEIVVRVNNYGRYFLPVYSDEGSIWATGGIGGQGCDSMEYDHNAGTAGNSARGGTITFDINNLTYLPSMNVSGGVTNYFSGSEYPKGHPDFMEGGIYYPDFYHLNTWRNYGGDCYELNCTGGKGGKAGDGNTIRIVFQNAPQQMIYGGARLYAQGQNAGRSGESAGGVIDIPNFTSPRACVLNQTVFNDLACTTPTVANILWNSSQQYRIPRVTYDGLKGGNGGDVNITYVGKFIPTISGLIINVSGGEGGQAGRTSRGHKEISRYCTGFDAPDCYRNTYFGMPADCVQVEPNKINTVCGGGYFVVTPYTDNMHIDLCYQWNVSTQDVSLLDGANAGSGGNAGRITATKVIVQSSGLYAYGGDGSGSDYTSRGGTGDYVRAGKGGDSGSGGNGGIINVAYGMQNSYDVCGGNAGDAWRSDINAARGGSTQDYLFRTAAGEGGFGGDGGTGGVCSSGCGTFYNYTGATGLAGHGGWGGTETDYFGYHCIEDTSSCKGDCIHDAGCPGNCNPLRGTVIATGNKGRDGISHDCVQTTFPNTINPNCSLTRDGICLSDCNAQNDIDCDHSCGMPDGQCPANCTYPTDVDCTPTCGVVDGQCPANCSIVQDSDCVCIQESDDFCPSTNIGGVNYALCSLDQDWDCTTCEEPDRPMDNLCGKDCLYPDPDCPDCRVCQPGDCGIIDDECGGTIDCGLIWTCDEGFVCDQTTHRCCNPAVEVCEECGDSVLSSFRAEYDGNLNVYYSCSEFRDVNIIVPMPGGLFVTYERKDGNACMLSEKKLVVENYVVPVGDSVVVGIKSTGPGFDMCPFSESTQVSGCVPVCGVGQVCVRGVCSIVCDPACAVNEVCVLNQCIPLSGDVNAVLDFKVSYVNGVAKFVATCNNPILDANIVVNVKDQASVVLENKMCLPFGGASEFATVVPESSLVSATVRIKQPCSVCEKTAYAVVGKQNTSPIPDTHPLLVLLIGVGLIVFFIIRKK